MAWLTRAILNARNDPAPVPMPEARTKDTYCHHGPPDRLGVPSALLLLSPKPAAPQLLVPLLVVTCSIPFLAV